MVIDHVGIAVRSIDDARKIWQDAFGYEPMTEPVVNTRQRVRVQFLRKKDSIIIKLVEPLDEASPFVGATAGGGCIHHLCFKCDDLAEGLEELKGKGLRVITQPEPGEAFEDEGIAFIYAKMGLKIELIDTDRKAKILP